LESCILKQIEQLLRVHYIIRLSSRSLTVLGASTLWYYCFTNCIYICVRTSSPVLTMWYCKVKIWWRKVKMCGFSSAKWFWPSIIAHFGVAGKRRSNTVHLREKECNKLDLTTNWPHHNDDGSRWFAISSSAPPTCWCPSISFIGGVAKKAKKTKLGYEKYFCKVTYWALLEMV
jgi:hypothetical protein